MFTILTQDQSVKDQRTDRWNCCINSTCIDEWMWTHSI